MKFRHIFEYAVFQVFTWLLESMPLRYVQKTGAFLGGLVYRLGFRRSVTMQNLRHAFPGWDNRSLEKLAQEAFKSIGTSFFELLWSPQLFKAGIDRIAKVENPEVLTEAKKKGKGVLVLTAHFGNWELMAQGVVALVGFPMLLIVKTQSNRFIDRQINEWRTRLGNTVVPMEVSVREALRTLQEGNIVGLAADQSAAKESLAVEFFGRAVPTFEGPATLSLKTGAAIILTLAIRQGDGTYRIRFEEVPKTDLTGYNPENVAELTRRHVRLTESLIRQYPEQWMWMHKRWKHVETMTISNHG